MRLCRSVTANPRKAVNELRPEGVSEYFTQLNDAVEADRKKREKKPLLAARETPKSDAVKDTKVSTTDPESGFMQRDNKPKGFFYLDHRTVDGKHCIIMDTHVTLDNVHDSQPFIGSLARQVERFGLEPVAVGGCGVLHGGGLPPDPRDGYRIGPAIVDRTKAKITSRRSTFGMTTSAMRMCAWQTSCWYTARQTVMGIGITVQSREYARGAVSGNSVHRTSRRRKR